MSLVGTSDPLFPAGRYAVLMREVPAPSHPEAADRYIQPGQKFAVSSISMPLIALFHQRFKSIIVDLVSLSAGIMTKCTCQERFTAAGGPGQ